MKILFVSTNNWVPWGGSEELWSLVALELAQQGHEIMVSTQEWDILPDRIKLLQQRALKVYLRNHRLPFGIVGKIWKRLMPSFGHGQDYKVLDVDSPHQVLINQGDIQGGVDWAVQCIEKKISYSLIVQLVNNLNVLTDATIDRLIQIYTSAEKVYFVSTENRILLEKMLATALPNAVIIRNPYKKLDKSIPYPSISTYNIAFIASLNVFHKGHDFLFEILKSEKWRTRPIQFNLYGSGPNEHYLKRLQLFYNLENVAFKGHQNIETIWSENHGLILCSRMEGQSLSLIESMYCERVPIVTNYGGAVELITDNVNGFIAMDANVNSIDDALERAWSLRHEWESMGQKAGQEIIKLYTKDAVSMFVDQLLNKGND